MEMKTTINYRLKEYLEVNKISPPEFYRKIGVGRMDYSAWMTAGRPISVRNLVAILQLYPDMNARWLLLGEGEISDAELGNRAHQSETSGKNCLECTECKSRQTQIELLLDHLVSLKEHITNLHTIVADKQSLIEQQTKEVNTLNVRLKAHESPS